MTYQVPRHEDGSPCFNTIKEDLDEMVKAYTAHNLERSGIVTGWILYVASARIDEEGENLYAYDYSLSPDIDLMRARGLTEWCRDAMIRDVNSQRNE